MKKLITVTSRFSSSSTEVLDMANKILRETNGRVVTVTQGKQLTVYLEIHTNDDPDNKYPTELDVDSLSPAMDPRS